MNFYEELLAKPETVTGNIWRLFVQCAPGSHRKKENPGSILLTTVTTVTYMSPQREADKLCLIIKEHLLISRGMMTFPFNSPVTTEEQYSQLLKHTTLD